MHTLVQSQQRQQNALEMSAATHSPLTGRVAIFVFGVASYALFLATFVYACGFVGNFFVPTAIDGPPGGSFWSALWIDAALIALFAVQHSVMARPGFKSAWTRVVPAAAERSAYVLLSSLALMLLFWQWRPLGGEVWDLRGTGLEPVLWAVFAFGWGLVLVTTFLIHHFDLFGLRQVWLHLQGKPYSSLRFVTPGPYRLVRHPLYVGWILAFWATPTMTSAHFVFALLMTAYILVAIDFEERDLIAYHGPEYEDYRRRVAMLIPRWRRGG